MKREINLEQFFTTDKNARFCLEKIDLSKFDLIVEPSAGEGTFSNLIENCLAFDIEPRNDKIIKQDYLELNIDDFANKKVLVIGNPPFGRQSSLAIKFINKSAEFANTIAFILPKSFKKESVINKLDKHLFLTEVYELPETKFYFDEHFFEIPCSFFVFEKRAEERVKETVPTVDDFSFVNKESADCSIRRVGFYAGKIEGLDVSETSHYFVKWNKPNSEENYRKLKFDFDNTVGARSLSKKEILRKYFKEFYN